MKTIKKLFTPVTFAIVILVVLVFGILYGVHTNKRNDFRTLVSAYPEGKKFVIVDDFKEYTHNDNGKETKIIKAYDVFVGKDKVGIIYVGETEGFGGPLQVAYGIRFEDDAIIGVSVILSNETPQYLQALLKHEGFLPQFAEKKLADENFAVDGVTGATPGGGTNTAVSPVTTKAFEKVLIAARAKYALDNPGQTGFKIPETVKLISKRQNYENLEQYIYTLEFEKQEIVVTVDKNYKVVSIDKAEFATDANKAKIETFISKNKLDAIITNIVVDNDTQTTTLTIESKGYASTITSEVVLDSEGKITQMTSDTKDETYNLGRWTEENGHPNEVLPGKIIENQTDDVDAVSRATETSNAIKAAARVAFDYAKEVIK